MSQEIEYVIVFTDEIGKQYPFLYDTNQGTDEYPSALIFDDRERALNYARTELRPTQVISNYGYESQAIESNFNGLNAIAQEWCGESKMLKSVWEFGPTYYNGADKYAEMLRDCPEELIYSPVSTYDRSKRFMHRHFDEVFEWLKDNPEQIDLTNIGEPVYHQVLVRIIAQEGDRLCTMMEDS